MFFLQTELKQTAKSYFKSTEFKVRDFAREVLVSRVLVGLCSLGASAVPSVLIVVVGRRVPDASGPILLGTSIQLQRLPQTSKNFKGTFGLLVVSSGFCGNKVF